MPGEWTPTFPLSSSNCKSVKWRANSKRAKLVTNPLGESEVRFWNGRLYKYFRVRYRKFISLRSSGSPGKLFYRAWRYSLPYTEQ